MGPVVQRHDAEGVDQYWQEVARGLILIFAALVSVWQRPIKK